MQWPSWKGTTSTFASCLRVNGCSSTCPCVYNTYDECFKSSSVHTPLCQYIYIGALEQGHGVEVNRCIEDLTKDTSWRGPVIAFARDSNDKPVVMGTSVFNRILAGFDGVSGVRINCDGLVRTHNVPRLEAITIKSYNLRGETGCRRFDPFDPEKASPLTRHTGITLQAKPERRWEDPNYAHLDRRNAISSLLAIPCEINKHNFGYYAPPHWTGNVIVMREDRKPLDVEYVQILCDWILNDTRPLFKKARAECTQITRQGFKGRPRTSRHRAIRAKVFEVITKQSLLAYSGGRLRDEDLEGSGGEEDEEMADIIENDDKTDDEMPGDGEESEASHSCEDEGEDMSDVEDSNIQDGEEEE
jgi:hypothetical protein